MRSIIIALLPLLAVPPIFAQERAVASREIDKQLYDSLKEAHNRGADLFNVGDVSGCFRYFQGALLTAKAVLAHRPSEQKFIDDALAEADKDPSIARRAFNLHESIEKLRQRLRVTPIEPKGTNLEKIEMPPRPIKPDVLIKPDGVLKPDPKPDGLIKPDVPKQDDKGAERLGPPRETKEKADPFKLPPPPPEGVIGRLIWKGEPLAGALIRFVLFGTIEVKEAQSDRLGRYQIEKVRPGKYQVLLSMPAEAKLDLPARYATASTTPLVVDVKGGETLDFVLR